MVKLTIKILQYPYTLRISVIQLEVERDKFKSINHLEFPIYKLKRTMGNRGKGEVWIGMYNLQGFQV